MLPSPGDLEVTRRPPLRRPTEASRHSLSDTDSDRTVLSSVPLTIRGPKEPGLLSSPSLSTGKPLKDICTVAQPSWHSKRHHKAAGILTDGQPAMIVYQAGF